MSCDNEQSQPPLKRRKVAESCKLCRNKKTRCDGNRPICAPCMEKGVACEWSDVTIPVSTSILLDIEARLRKLERGTRAVPAQSPADTLVPDTLITSTGPSRSPYYNPFQVLPALRTAGADSETESPFPDLPATQLILDMSKIAGVQLGGQLPLASLWGKTNEWPVETDTSAMVVPKRAIADNLFDCYENLVYPLFPILHMPTFRQKYERLWSQPKQVPSDSLAAEATFHATLNIVFALGCINNSNVEPHLKLRTAESFYRRARAILSLDALDIPSLEVVQYLLLTTSYLTFTKYSNRCLNILAVAIRIAQTLGLHRDVESSSSSQLRREMSRRVWHICLVMERLLSTQFGRRGLIKAESKVPLPEKIDDEYLLENGIGTQPSEKPSIIDALIATIDMFEVIEGAQEINYGTLPRGLRLPELTEILQLNEKLDKIEATLPPYLKGGRTATSNTPRDRILMLQATGVMTRMQIIRLIILRPNVLAAARQSVLASIPDSSSSRTEITLSTEISNICVQAAISSINMLHANLGSDSRIFSSNAVFVTLSAATVLVTASLVPELRVNLEDCTGPYGDAVAKALQILDEHRCQIEGALRAKALLEQFVETVGDIKRRRENSNKPPGSSSQLEGSQVPPRMHEICNEFDFSEPLWDFQWAMPTPLFDSTAGFNF